MINVIQLFGAKAAAAAPVTKPNRPAPPKDLKSRETKFTIEDLRQFDYRASYMDAVDEHRRYNKLSTGAADAELSKLRFRTVDLSYGALIAAQLKRDTEGAVILSQHFQQALVDRVFYGTLSDLPSYVRGYIWNHYPVLMAWARATVSPPPPPS